MVNANKVRGRMAEMGVTQRKLAETLNLSQSTVSLKLKGIRPMMLDEAESIAATLAISNADFASYFFSREVAQRN